MTLSRNSTEEQNSEKNPDTVGTITICVSTHAPTIDGLVVLCFNINISDIISYLYINQPGLRAFQIIQELSWQPFSVC